MAIHHLGGTDGSIYVFSNSDVHPTARAATDGPKVLLIHAHGGYIASEALPVAVLPASPRFIFQVRPGRAADQDELNNRVIPKRLWKEGYEVDAGDSVPDYYLYKYWAKQPAPNTEKAERKNLMKGEVKRLMQTSIKDDYMGKLWRAELGDDFDVLIPKNRRADRVDKLGKSGLGVQTGAVRFSRVIERLQGCKYEIVFCSFCRVDFDDESLKYI